MSSHKIIKEITIQVVLTTSEVDFLFNICQNYQGADAGSVNAIACKNIFNTMKDIKESL